MHVYICLKFDMLKINVILMIFFSKIVFQLIFPINKEKTDKSKVSADLLKLIVLTQILISIQLKTTIIILSI